MEQTKSNENLKRDVKENIFHHLSDLWKADVNWNKLSTKNKNTCIWFGLSFCSLLVFCHTWLVIPSAISLICSIVSIEGVNVEE